MSIHKTLSRTSVSQKDQQTKELISPYPPEGVSAGSGKVNCPGESSQNEGEEKGKCPWNVTTAHCQEENAILVSPCIVPCTVRFKSLQVKSVPDPHLKASAGSGSLKDIAQITCWLKAAVSLG